MLEEVPKIKLEQNIEWSFEQWQRQKKQPRRRL